MATPTTTGKVLTRRVRAADGTTVQLHYRQTDANAMRAFVQSITLKGSRKAPLSLIARRSMQFYLSRMETARATRPDIYAAELAVLERMVTPVPKPAPKSRGRAAVNE